MGNWARWKRHGGAPNTGYAQLSGVSGSLSFEDMTRDMDRKHAAIMDQLVGELPTLERGAVCHVWLGERYILQLHLGPALERAYIYLAGRMADKDLD